MIINDVIAIGNTIFKNSSKQLDENSSIDNIDSWDSINHLKFLLALEEFFNINFNIDEYGKLSSIHQICNSILEKI